MTRTVLGQTHRQVRKPSTEAKQQPATTRNNLQLTATTSNLTATDSHHQPIPSLKDDTDTITYTDPLKNGLHEDTPKNTHADEVPPTPTPAARTHAPRAREPAPQCLEGPPDPAQPAVHHERAYLGCAALRAHLRLSEPP